jgi:lipopolysaccharide export system permease protein
VATARFLLLSNGQRLENTLEGRRPAISEFETWARRSAAGGLAHRTTPRPRPVHLALLRDPHAREPGRAGVAPRHGAGGVNFVLLAVTVSSVNPRVGRSGNLVFALFAFVVYYNLLNLGQSWISGGRTAWALHAGLLHGGTFLVGVALAGQAAQQLGPSQAAPLRRLREPPP